MWWAERLSFKGEVLEEIETNLNFCRRITKSSTRNFLSFLFAKSTLTIYGYVAWKLVYLSKLLDTSPIPLMFYPMVLFPLKDCGIEFILQEVLRVSSLKPSLSLWVRGISIFSFTMIQRNGRFSDFSIHLASLEIWIHSIISFSLRFKISHSGIDTTQTTCRVRWEYLRHAWHG